MKTFAEHVIHFNKNLTLKSKLPKNIELLHPYKENPEVLDISSAFYQKFYADTLKRKLIVGINPGRLGAGATGVPFTDTKRLKSHCHIEASFQLHEPSSVFVYEVIDAYGDIFEFYKHFYISSVCPLGFVIRDDKGRYKNYNYYDSAALTKKVTPFIVESIKKQLAFGIDTQEVFCMGTGKNHKYLKALNDEYAFFKNVIPLEHPRYVMQYKSKSKKDYIKKYIDALKA